MAFLIPDNLRSRRDVSEGIRKVASALQTGLDDSATLWYEPLFDPSGQKPHFVLLVPDRGIVVLELLEVKSSAGLLGILRGKLRIARDGKEVEVENPLERANRFAVVLRERIAAEPRLANLDVRVTAGAAFHVLTREEAAQKGLARAIAPDLCLFREDIEAGLSGSGEAHMQRAIARILGGELGDRLAADVEKVLRGVIQPETVIDRRAGNASDQLVIFRPPADGTDVLRVMDRQQEAMAKSLGEGHRVIRGVAGSGKTLILVYRARLLSRLFPVGNILLTCYTRSLAGQLRDALADCPNVTVRHLDKLMWDFTKKAGLKHPGYEDDDSGERVAAVALQAVARVKEPRYQAVLLDEAQDFSDNALRFALGLLEPGREDFVLVADAAQNIFRRRFRFKDVGIQAQGRTRILRTNYRNTKEILEGARRFLLAGGELREEAIPGEDDEMAVIPPEAALRSGVRPSVALCTSEAEESNAVARRVKGWLEKEKSPRSVAILYTTNDGRIQAIERALRDEGIGVFWLSDPRDRSARDRISSSSDPVVLTTIHSAKGLEFPRVVLTGPPKEGSGGTDYRKLAYVGMTRATEELEVIVGSEHPFANDFRQAFAGESN